MKRVKRNIRKLGSEVKDALYDNNTGLKKRVVFSVLIVTLGLGVSIWFFHRLLYIEDYYNPEYKINLPAIGQMGDFVGGVAGTLFTLVGIILLFETLALQRIEFTNSRRVFEKQQFDNTLFSLLDLYQSLNFRDHEDKVFKGKSFFERNKKELQTKFNTRRRPQSDRKQAKDLYLAFYASNKFQVAHYFRTLYRIFRHIETSNLTKKDKMNYSKIIRSQLSEAELFFLYYNSNTEYGAKFRPLVNKYSILKHLPTIEKLEFQRFLTGMDEIKRNNIEFVLNDLRNLIFKAQLGQKNPLKTYLQGTFTLTVNWLSQSKIQVKMITKKNLNYPKIYQQGYGLDDLAPNQFQSLIVEYLNDLISYSNYFEFNGREIDIEKEISEDIQNDKGTLLITVSRRNNLPIKILSEI